MTRDGRQSSPTVTARGKQSPTFWWEAQVTDEDLQTLFTARYTGPDAVVLQEETALGGKSIEEQLLARQKYLSEKLSDASLRSYKVALRLFYKWAKYREKQQESSAQHNWYIAHPDSKLDSFFEDVLAPDGPWCSKGNSDFVASTKVLCAALIWLRKLQPGVPRPKDISYIQAKAVTEATRLRVQVQSREGYDMLGAGGPSSKVLEDWEVDRLLQCSAVCVTRDCHWKHKGIFSLLSSVSGGLRVDDLSCLRYANLALSQTIQSQPTPHMQLLHICTTQSKTNQSGQVQTITFARHVDPNKCMHGALARLIVYDLLVYQLLVIDMMRAGDLDWRAVHLLWRDPGDIMNDTNYNDIVGPLKRALDQEGIRKAAVGHLGRNTGVAKLAALGVPLPLMKIWGRWFTPGDVLEGSYLPKALLKDLETAAQLGGHGPQWRTQHYLGRQMVKPPAHWIDAVMPGARAALFEVTARNSHAGRCQERDSSAEVCLQAMLHLAEVFWQDMACDQHCQHPELRQLPAVLEIMETPEYAAFQRQVQTAHGIMQQQQQMDPSQRMQSVALLSHVQQRLNEVLVAAPTTVGPKSGCSPSMTTVMLRCGQQAVQTAKGSVWGLLSPLTRFWSASTRPAAPTSLGQAMIHSSTCTHRSQQDPQRQQPALIQQDQQQHAAPARREAPPLFSSKLKTVTDGWAEWQGLRTGRPGVKQLLQQISEDASMNLGRSNSNAKWLRIWLLRAVDAATAVGMSEAEALVRLQAVADSFTPRLTYLELLTAIAIMVKHQDRKPPQKQETVRGVSVADMLQVYTQQHLAVPAAPSSSRQSCVECKQSRKRAGDSNQQGSSQARAVKARSTRAGNTLQ